MSRKVSIQSIADQLGLSKYAVSRALSGKPGVSQITRERVIELARSLGYQITRHDNDLPAETADGSSFVIIFMNQNNRGDPSYWQRVLDGLIAGCSERGWHHVIVSPPASITSTASASSPGSDQVRLPQQAIAPHLDWKNCVGMAAMGSFPFPTLQQMVRTGKPLVLVDHKEPMLACDTVNHSNVEAGMVAARHLLAKQCRRIVYLGDDGRSSSFAERRIGVQLAVERHRGPATVELVHWELPYEEGKWQETAEQRFADLLPEWIPDAWIGANDDIAVRWMQLLQHKGYSVPAQCRVVGIDNVEEAALASPPLTTVSLYKEQLGERAIEALQRRCERPGVPAETIELSASLIPRDSA